MKIKWSKLSPEARDKAVYEAFNGPPRPGYNYCFAPIISQSVDEGLKVAMEARLSVSIRVNTQGIADVWVKSASIKSASLRESGNSESETDSVAQSLAIALLRFKGVEVEL